jgi:hypothetical protein
MTDLVKPLASAIGHDLQRRTTIEIATIKNAIYQTCQDEAPVTVRRLFYRLVSLGLVRKTETEYKHTVIRLATDMRRVGDLPFEWIADASRWVHKRISYRSLEEWARASQELYRRHVWAQQPVQVHIWSEKEGIASAIARETYPWDVPLLIAKGFSSVTYLHNAAMDLRNDGRPAFIYWLGDWDPSGLTIPDVVERDLRTWAGREVDITFERLAITAEQIATYALPTRPTKTTTHGLAFTGESVEVDALDMNTLRGLVAAAIEQHVDEHQREQTERIEVLERERISDLLGQLGNGRT